MTYVQSHFCNSMIDPDIYLLQVSQLDNRCCTLDWKCLICTHRILIYSYDWMTTQRSHCCRKKNLFITFPKRRDHVTSCRTTEEALDLCRKWKQEGGKYKSRTLFLSFFFVVSIGKASQGRGNTLELASLNNFGGFLRHRDYPWLSGTWSWIDLL